MRVAELISWMRTRVLSRSGNGARADAQEAPGAGGLIKLLPVIRQDYCTGCRACIDACDNGCLELVWDFATLVRAEDCASDGKCVQACPDELIRMEWVASTCSQP